MSSSSAVSGGGPFPLPHSWTLGDLQRHLGGIPIDRVQLFPPPGTGTAARAEAVQREGDRLCEVVDGVLVVKPVYALESLVAMDVAYALRRYLEEHVIGVVLGADGLLQIGPNLVCGPDVSFISWERFPGRKLLTDRVWAVVPDLAVEVLSPENTPAEMEPKVADFLAAGTKVVWIIDPATRTAVVHEEGAANGGVQSLLLPNGAMTARSILPGFVLALAGVLRVGGI